MLRSPLVRNLLLVLAAAFFLLRFVHVAADYPRNIRWDDGIVTDEGWYASGAINQQTWGSPLMDGDMNIPVIMPLWSVIAKTAFSVGGFSVVTLRVTAILFFFLCTGLSCILLRRFGARDWIPLFLAMMACNPWAFAFSRAAFLEFPMLSLVLLAAVVLPKQSDSTFQRVLKIAGAGIIFALALLLKTTAVALAPLSMYALLERQNFEWRKTLREAVIFFSATGALYGAYWLSIVRPHLVDVHFYLSVVKNTLRLDPYGFIADTSRPFRYGLGSDHLLFSLSLIAVISAVIFRRFRALWKDPLFAFAGVWLIVFLGFMVKHNNDPARYFAITIPASMFVGIALLRNTSWGSARAHQVFFVIIAIDVAINGLQVIASQLHPRYSFHHAAADIAGIVHAEDPHNPVVIGDEMHEVALHNGLRPVNLLFHSDTVMAQMTRYKPGWWLQFLPVDDGRCFREVLSSAYSAEYRKEWMIFYPGQKLVLWKLTPKPGSHFSTTLTEQQTAACTPPVYN